MIVDISANIVVWRKDVCGGDLTPALQKAGTGLLTALTGIFIGTKAPRPTLLSAIAVP